MDGVLHAAERFERQVASARLGITFERAVMGFIRLLASVPDPRSSPLTTDEMLSLRAVAERVVEQIESRLDGHRDRTSVKHELAGAVYRIRRETEAIDLWHRQRRSA